MATRGNGISIAKAWEELFERHDILNKIQENGYFRISATEINTLKEARLMARFDQSSKLPDIFKDNNLSILPVSRGDYLIGPYKTHHRVDYDDVELIPVKIPDLETIDYTNLYSESSALLFAYNSGIVSDILESISKVYFTVNGRMGSGNFDFKIDSTKQNGETMNVSVLNSQIEIDAGYETDDFFCIFEAKNVAVEELIIRQLYYPYRLWRSKISKPVIPVFLVFSNDIFHAFIYRFTDDNHYNSIELIGHKAYTFASEAILRTDVDELIRRIVMRAEPSDIPFPQANSFERIVDLLSILFDSELTTDEVTNKYVFDVRQTDYYITACVYLGLVKRVVSESGETKYQLTPEAQDIMKKNFRGKYLGLIQRVLEFPVFNEVYKKSIETGLVPDVPEIVPIMKHHGVPLGEGTLMRRASTVKNWVAWILNQFDVE